MDRALGRPFLHNYQRLSGKYSASGRSASVNIASSLMERGCLSEQLRDGRTGLIAS